MKRTDKLIVSCLALAATTLSVSAQQTFEKIAFMGDNVEINGQGLGWNASSPVVVEINPQTGNFEFTARFTTERSLWQMYTDAIGVEDWGALKASIYTPNFYSAFSDMDTEPEDLAVNVGGVECFNKSYLTECIGKKVIVYSDPDGGFWVGGTNLPVFCKIILSGDLTEMTVESAKIEQPETGYPENLWIYGDATPGGWDLEKATPMTNLGNGIYRYIGELKSGEPGVLQIYAENPSVCGPDAKAYGPAEPQTITCWGVSDKNLSYYESRPGTCYYQIQAGQTNNYVLTVDVVNNTISVLFDNLYFVGEPSDWQFKHMESVGYRTFSYKGYFAANKSFLFTATEGWDAKIASGTGDISFGLADFSDNTMALGSQAAIRNTYEGYYVLTVDLDKNTLYTRTYNPDPIEKLFVLCNGKYNEMTAQQDGTYIWVGTPDKDFVVTPGNNTYPCYMPGQENLTVPATGISNGKMIFNTTAANNVDTKWVIGTPELYTVKVNPSAMTINVEKGDATGVNTVMNDNSDAPVDFYDLMGRKIQNPEKGIYIRVQGGTAKKVFIQ